MPSNADHSKIIAQAAKERAEAHQRRMQEVNPPSPSLDGNALGQALLKNLGFKS